ncbi:hypothetical protein PPSIR1_28353 [Plesiocystis pacifica SIR-1]|uniref:Uncharacterized protein n=1 Tax=Plesiocystis pacifica SIR-1 TaxID=391625 RepID=A6FZU3_9BACT|nr:hypothetical protein [Plesiocystis pacifica]EDM80899.1 hypothetical protein PPSIR1_28353 [Plesiocystis pacifica SIR-1]
MQVSGHVIRSRYMYVRQAGDEAYQKILAELGPAGKDMMDGGPLETVWYPFDVFVELNVAVDKVLGRGDMQLVEELGRFSCEHNLTGIYRIFFRFGNLNFLLDRAAKAWHSQFDFGTMTVHRDPNDRHRVTLKLAEVPKPHRALYLGIKGWAMRATELTGSEIVDFVDGYSDDPNEAMTWGFEYL